MEAVKLSRRRISNLDCDGYRQMKRRMVNGVCHLEGGGGAWHMKNILSDKTSPPTAAPGAAASGFLTDMKQQSPANQQQLDLNPHPALNGAEGYSFHHHQLHHQTGPGANAGHPPPPPHPPPPLPPPPPLLEPAQQLPTMSQPVLPPSLRESERMQSVERWINSIPLDAPVYAQTSLTQIVPISDPKSFPDELSVSDHTPTRGDANVPSTSGGTGGVENPRGGVSYEYHSQQQHQQSQAGYASCGGGGGGGAGVASRGNTTTASSGNHLPPPPPPGGGGGGGSNYQSPARTGPYHGATPLPSPPPAHNQRIRDRSFMRGPPNRFFDDYETQFVVKLFSDYFASGNCPSLSEVRRRTAHSQLQARRNASSIRAKVKRLQASGRWTDYAIL